MSIWSNLTGTYRIHQSKAPSFKKLCKDYFDGDDHTCSSDTTSPIPEVFEVVFSVSLREGGKAAVEYLQGFIDYVESFGVSWVELEMRIRYY